ncbi:hypothetical protein Tco_1060399, partial [Tanacetum coccineum]
IFDCIDLPAQPHWGINDPGIVYTAPGIIDLVPKQEHGIVLNMPIEIVEEDKEYTCLTSHQCDVAEIKAPSMETTNSKGKAEKIDQKTNKFRICRQGRHQQQLK